MNQEEEELIKEFSLAINTAHTALFSSHLEKQLESLKKYVDRHSDEMDKFIKERLNAIHENYQIQIKKNEKNYLTQINTLKEQNGKINQKFGEKIDSLLEAIHKPIAEIKKELSNNVDTLLKHNNEQTNELSKKFNNEIVLLNEYIDLLNNEIIKYNEATIKSFISNREDLSEKYELLEQQINSFYKEQESFNIYINDFLHREIRKNRIYYYAPTFIAVIIIISLVIYFNI